MRKRRLGDRLALLLAAALGVAGLTAAPTATADEEPAEIHGLKGEYYTHSAKGAFDFHELKATVFDPQLDFDTLEPRLNFATGQSDDVSVRWTGSLVPEKSGAHTFSVIGDNGFRLWIDGKLAIDHWVDDWDREQTAEPIELTAGQAVDIKVEYFEHYGGSNLHLRWTPPGGTKAPVPQSAFRLPADFDYNGPVATEVLASGRTLKLDFAKDLAAPPAGLTDHLEAVIGGATWPLDGAALDPADASVLLVALDEPVVGNKTGTARGSADLRYDGEGGLTDTDGNVVNAFVTTGANHSTYELRTRWADEVGPDNALPEYPRPQLTRGDWRNLNGRWQFAAAEAGEQPPVGKNLKERILVPYPVESQLSGIQRHEDRMWYRRTFEVPKDWRVGKADQRLRLNFGAVDWQSEVYVNGVKVADHKGGFDKFSADVTDALKPGRTQELIVGVYDPTDSANGENPPVGKQRLDPSGIWYTPSSGIWQTVWMEPVAADHVDNLKLVPDAAAGTVTVEPQGVRDGVRVTATAYDGKRKVATVSGRTGKALTLKIRNPKLWSPDDPFLYDLKVTVGSDRVGSYFGLRDISVQQVDGVPRTMLNGEPVFLMATLDQGFWPDGLHTAPTDEALEHDLKLHKQLGYNSVRKHIKVEPDRWFYHADRLGLLVWQDMPAMTAGRSPSTEARAQYEREMKEMIDEHISSPSVVMWVTFNEGWGQYDIGRVAQQAKAWDPTRLVNNQSGLNLGADGGAGDLMDEHGYPSPALPPSPDGKRALVTGEYGGLGLGVPGHAWSVQMSYVDVDPETYTEDYLTKLDEVRALVCRGSNGAVYTQISDVEGELNGLTTYDRAVVKPDVERVRAAHEALIGDASQPAPAGCPAP
ncbi:PA14 domain-containing protein [Streptomyces sp. CRN 30]|uniref:PA14 domain-containing protein n=1 Tax=Streptomyces sp. CRN 30 TaxID=3075613 RepID=UPI002A839096|nr:PA14 domain-containing protein [Streptomyces sp. CRN 30]